MFYDIPTWISQFKEENISFSCGSRIHGNIAATLAGIPALVMYRDARTRELAEIFELPNSPGYDAGKSLSLYEKLQALPGQGNLDRIRKHYERYNGWYRAYAKVLNWLRICIM